MLHWLYPKGLVITGKEQTEIKWKLKEFCSLHGLAEKEGNARGANG